MEMYRADALSACAAQEDPGDCDDGATVCTTTLCGDDGEDGGHEGRMQMKLRTTAPAATELPLDADWHADVWHCNTRPPETDAYSDATN